MRIFRLGLLLLLVFGIEGARAETLPALKRAARAIRTERLLEHIRELSSDAYAGRFPGTPGEEKSVAYLIAQCKAMGLEPGNPQGGWVQEVPLYGLRSKGQLKITAGGKELPLTAGKDYVAWSTMPVPEASVRESELVFAGYGVVAPEYQWDDYAGLDVRGKTVLALSGDPAVTDPKDPSKLDERWFLGNALTVHGRTGTKLDAAFSHGAAAVILVYSSQQPGANLFQNFARENMILEDGTERKRVNAQALLALDRAKELFEAAGRDWDGQRAAAAKPGFRGYSLGAVVSMEISNQVRKFESQNVVAKLEGSDPRRKGEYVIYSAHWDHHGQEGNVIFHGASDNAAGTAGVLELARAFRALRPAPARTVVFLFPTAEEKGLLGARYFVEQPLYPLAATVANINLDYFSNWGWGRTRDFSIVGIGNSTLDDLTAGAVRRQGRVLTGDTAPEQGFYFRSDHYEFARVGVPSLETSPGIEHLGRPAGFGAEKRAEYIRHDYHQESDVIKPGWDLRGAVEDLQVLLEVGYRVSQEPGRPQWKPDAVWRPRAEPVL